MTRKVISVRQDASFREAAQMLYDWGFEGLPVLDKNKKLVGIFTQYDLLSSDRAMHIPTLQRLFETMSVDREDKKHFEEAIRPLENLSVSDAMNDDPLTLSPEATLDEIIRLFREHHRVNPVPVIDKDRRVLGVVSRYDIVKLFGYTKDSTASDTT